MVTKDFQHAMHRCFQLFVRKGIWFMKNKVFLHHLQNINVKNISEIQKSYVTLKKKIMFLCLSFQKLANFYIQRRKINCYALGKEIFISNNIQNISLQSVLSHTYTLNPSVQASVFRKCTLAQDGEMRNQDTQDTKYKTWSNCQLHIQVCR